jgi:DNA-binding response OmpR family regulator
VVSSPEGSAVVRILAVDDDPVIIDLLRLNFELEGHEVSTAADGRSALELARSSTFDVIVLDVMMPAPDGFSVCETLRAEPATADVAILLLTARAQTADRDRGVQAGADAFVTKPFDPLELVEVVESLASGSRPLEAD